MSETKPNYQLMIIKWIPGLLISLVAIFLLLKFVNINELKVALSQINVVTLLVIALLVVLSMLARGFAWKIMIGKSAKYCDTFFGVCVGYMLNNFIPRSGEIGKAVLIGSSTGLGTLHILSTVIVERALDLVIAAGFFLSTLPLVLQMEWMKPIAILLLVLVAGVLLVLFILANNKEKVHAWMTKISENKKFINKYLLPGLESVLNGFSVLTNAKQFILTCFGIGLSWACWTLLFYFTLISYVPDAPFWWSLFSQGVLAMGIALPSAPAGLGVYEGTLVVALSAFSVAQSTALGMALVMHLTQIAITTVLGIIGLSRGGWSLKSLINKTNLKNS